MIEGTYEYCFREPGATPQQGGSEPPQHRRGVEDVMPCSATWRDVEVWPSGTHFDAA